MLYFKDFTERLYAIDGIQHKGLLPPDVIELTPSEYEALVSPPRMLNQVYTEALFRLHTGYEAELAFLRKIYPPSEREGWGLQVEAARAQQAAQPSPIIDGIAAARGKTPAEVSVRILAKLDQYDDAYAAATGKIGALREQADAALLAEDAAALDLITW